MSKKVEERDLSIEDEGYLENDMIQILERLNCGYVSYIQIHTMMNYPFLRKKDMVALRKSEHYQVYDFVLYCLNGFYFLRRIVAIDEGKYYVCGDHEYKVRVIEAADIIAKGISRERGTKRLSLILRNKKKLYTKAVTKKGKLRIKNHTFYDDETTLTGVYDKALSSKMIVSSEDDKAPKEILPEMPLDARLSLQLQIFQSPEERLKEFEAQKQSEDEKINFEEQSSIEY